MDWLEVIDVDGKRTGRRYTWDDDGETDSWEKALAEAKADADSEGPGAAVYLYENGRFKEVEYTA